MNGKTADLLQGVERKQVAGIIIAFALLFGISSAPLFSVLNPRRKLSWLFSYGLSPVWLLMPCRRLL